MSGGEAQRSEDAIAAEAALWTIRTAGRRDPGLERWIEEHPRHRAAFAEASRVWRDLGKVARPVAEQPVARPRLASAPRAAWAMALAACLLAVVAVTQLRAPRDLGYATAIGEQRSLRLADQTMVMLNTDTRIDVDYDAARRRVVLERGEALFEVAHNPARPFYVEVGGDYVRAVGTAFTVRRDAGGGFEVTLLSGKVLVGTIGAATARLALVPGDRLRLGANHRAAIDHPVLDDVTAWRRGQLVFDATPLAAAVAEMNRYSARPVQLRGTLPATARLSGVFETGESEAFARTVAAIYGLQPRKTATGFTLQAPPAAPPR